MSRDDIPSSIHASVSQASKHGRQWATHMLNSWPDHLLCMPGAVQGTEARRAVMIVAATVVVCDYGRQEELPVGQCWSLQWEPVPVASAQILTLRAW